MSLQIKIQDLTVRVATEFKATYARMGSLSALDTTAKGDLVSAINEINSAAASATGINDAATATTTTWSSSKINTQINAAVPTWTTLSGKPATFPPTIGTTATTAKAGNCVPTWGEVTGKPTFAAVATSGSYADLTGTIPTSALPPLAINETFPVASQTAMLALTAQRGDIAIRSDNGRTYILASDSPSTLADWKEISAAGQVTSVAGRTGAVVLTKTDVGLSNVDNTSDASKPVSTATQTALNAKANTTHTHTTNDLSDASSVGKSVLTAATTTAARTAIGAGTSDLTIGTTGTTAAAGNHTHVAANITDTTTTGRAVMTAVDATAARTAIGAGTSNLVIGNTAGTAQDSAAVGDTEVNLVSIFEAALV